MGYSYKRLAELSGIPVGTVQKVLGGITKAPRYETLKALEKALRPVEDDWFCYDWAKDAILALNKKGIVSGVGNGKFEPGRAVNREEFAKLLCETFGLEKTDEASSFTDVANGSWYEVYVMTANKHGIINGVEESVFGTGRNITREDMVTMLYRAICAKGIEISDEGTVFEDDNEISDYAKDAVLKMCAKGVVNGVGENKFAPKKSATRAEAAVILKRVTDTFLD